MVLRRKKQQRRLTKTVRGQAGFLQFGCKVLSLLFLVILFSQYLALTTKDGKSTTRLSREKRTKRWVSDSSQLFNLRGAAHQAKHLIVVAGHSVTVSGHLEDADKDESDWFLLDYQKHRGLPQAIVKHIEKGIELAAQDASALLVFSGGETRGQTGPETEGSSYFRVSDAMNLWPPQSSADATTPSNTVRARTVTEEFATDSFENLMFSICRFHEVTGSYPTKITVVSFSFKERRFRELHAQQALRWPPEQFEYWGIDPPASTGFDLEESTRGERENAAHPFESDPYGCHSAVLREKRKQRNPFYRTPPYELSCPEMKELLHYCGPDLIDEHKVPWGGTN